MVKFAVMFVGFFLLLATISALKLYNSKEQREIFFFDVASKNIKIEKSTKDPPAFEPRFVYRCLEHENNSFSGPTSKVYYIYDITENDVTPTGIATGNRIDSITKKVEDENNSHWYDWRGHEGEMSFIVSVVGGASGGITVWRVVDYLNKYRDASVVQRVLVSIVGGASGWYVGKLIATQLMTPKCDSKELLYFLWQQDKEKEITTDRWKKLESIAWNGLVAKLNRNISKLPAEQGRSLKDELQKIFKSHSYNKDFSSSDFSELMELEPDLNKPSESQFRVQQEDPASILREELGRLKQ